MSEILKYGHVGQAVADLQGRLRAKGFDAPATSVYDADTRAAVLVLQRRAGLVADGIYGPKSAAALAGLDGSRSLREVDLIAAAERLGVSLAAIKAVNAVESQGSGFLPDGRTVILYERHIMVRRLREHGIDPAGYIARSPAIVNTVRGGYAGGAAEYTRLATALDICRPAALESCSWGAFQVMGYHWKALQYSSIEDFVLAHGRSEADHLDGFVRYIEINPTLHRALKARKWAQFAEGYNGPAYAQHLYDVRLAREYERFAADSKEAVA